ncbi:hypothetical protein TNCV_4176351 [Trichonephila clavipes]|nr:hypothetical protein TNCV_4176351 [Trichonephila clavipes]
MDSTSGVTYTPGSRRGSWILEEPKYKLCYCFAILCKIRFGAQNQTLQEGPNILRYASCHVSSSPSATEDPPCRRVDSLNFWRLRMPSVGEV